MQETLQRRNCKTSLDTLNNEHNSRDQLDLINEEYFNHSLMKTQIHSNNQTLLLPRT